MAPESGATVAVFVEIEAIVAEGRVAAAQLAVVFMVVVRFLCLSLFMDGI
jgi:hypothetical protein